MGIQIFFRNAYNVKHEEARDCSTWPRSFAEGNSVQTRHRSITQDVTYTTTRRTCVFLSAESDYFNAFLSSRITPARVTTRYSCGAFRGPPPQPNKFQFHHLPSVSTSSQPDIYLYKYIYIYKFVLSTLFRTVENRFEMYSHKCPINSLSLSLAWMLALGNVQAGLVS